MLCVLFVIIVIIDFKQKLGELHSENMPFEFIKKGCGQEVRMAPCVRVKSLEEMVFRHLDEHERLIE